MFHIFVLLCLLVPAHPGCPGQSPQRRKMAVCVFVTAKVMDSAAPAVSKPLSAAETAVPPKSSKKSSSDQSDSLSVTTSTQANTSPVTSVALSTSMEQKDDDDTYILLDECVSGPASISSMTSSWLASLPSPDNMLAVKNVSDNYVNLSHLPPNQERVHSPGHDSLYARRSVDGVFEGAVQPESGSSMDVDVPDGHCTNGATQNLEYMSHSESNGSHLPPALPAKMYLPSDVEYDVPSSLSVSSSSYAIAAPMLVSPAAPPPRRHMAPGRMHRYINTAPVLMPRNPVESSNFPVGGHHLPPQQSTTSLPLPPKSHG